MNPISVQSPRGVDVTLYARAGTSDLATIGSTFRLWDKLDDEYGLADLVRDSLVDVGAHIGSVCIAFLVDNTAAKAIAIEPLPENVAMIEKNAESAGVSDRLTIINAAIGTPVIHYGTDDHRFIGNIAGSTQESAIVADTVTLSEIIERFGIPDIVKTDCEGCEWSLFADPAIAQVPLIIGEYHQNGPQALKDALDATHVVTADSGDTGNFRAVRR